MAKEGKTAAKVPESLAGADPVIADLVLHNSTLRAMGERFARIAVIASAVAGVSLIVLAVVFFTKPAPQYFLADAQGRIMRITPVDQPYEDVARLTQWTARAVMESFSLDFVRWQEVLAQARQYYTAQGYDNLLKSMQDSGLLDTVKKNRYVMTAALRSAPVVLKEGRVEGRFIYVIRVPVIVTFYQGNNQSSASWDMEVLVVRVPPSENAYGVAIHQVVAKRST